MFTLSILLPTLDYRSWQKLLVELLFQVNQANRVDLNRVELLVENDRGEMTSGQKRQKLVNRSTGKWIVFIDDDDMVSADYIEKILTAIEQNPSVDVITFNLKMTLKKRKSGRTHHSEVEWSFGLHQDNRRTGKMAANHLCAWRRDIATRVAWCPSLGYADDQVWYQPIHAAGLVKTEAHIDAILYHYHYCSINTANQTSQRILAAKRYVGRGLRCYLSGGEILVEVGGVNHPETKVTVRDSANQVKYIPSHFVPFHVIKIK